MNGPEYIHFDFQTRQLDWPESKLRLYPLVCMHIGAAQCDMKFIRAQIKRIKEDPCARWVYMGDGGECVTLGSKGDIYEQLCGPGTQLDILDDLLQPIADKGLFGIRGNHGNRVYKATGIQFDKQLMLRLGLPYLGAAAWANLVVNRSSYDCYFHHGIDSGTALRSKIAKAEAFNMFVNADAIFTAHSHIAQDLTPFLLYEADNGAQTVRSKLRHQYICGCAYDSRRGYAEDKGYPPLLPAWLIVEFDGRINGGYAVKHQSSETIRTTADYELNHDYMLDYLGKGN